MQVVYFVSKATQQAFGLLDYRKEVQPGFYNRFFVKPCS